MTEPARLSRPGTPLRTATDPYNLLSAVVLAWAVGVVVQHTWTTDFLLHVATVRAMARDLTHPPDPMVGTGFGSPYYSPYIVLASAIVRWFGLSPAAVFGGLALVNTVLLLWAFRRFCGWFTSSAGAAVALLATLFLWGIRPPVWSGFLSMRSLAEVLPYPSTFAFALMLLAWHHLLRYRRSRQYPDLVALGMLASVITLTHSFTAANTAIGAVAVLIAHRSGWSRRDLVAIGLTGVSTLVVVAAWPYSSLLSLFADAPEFADIHRQLLDAMLDPRQLSCAYVVLGVAALLLRPRRDRFDVLVLAFAITAAVVVFGIATGQYQFLRTVPVAMLTAHVALGAFITGPDCARIVWRRVAAFAAIGVLVAGLIVDVTPLNGFLGAVPRAWLPDSADRMTQTSSLSGPSQQFNFLRSYVPEGLTILTDSRWSDRHLNWLGYYTVNPGWPDPWLADAEQRARDRTIFLDAGTSPAARAQLADNYEARCVLIIKTPQVTAPDAVAGFRQVYAANGSIVYCR
jgi:hypothetical protein